MLPALTALAVNNNACAGSIRTKDPVFEIQIVLLVIHTCLFLNRSAAIHAVLAFDRDNNPAV